MKFRADEPMLVVVLRAGYGLGRFALARLARGTGKEWLLMKTKDTHADPKWTLKSDLTPQRLKKLAVKVPPYETS